MALDKDEALKLFERLPEIAQLSAYDYLQYLSSKHDRLDWDSIEKLEPDEITLSEEEQRQFSSNDGFMSWEEAMHELNLPTDAKS